MARFFVGQPVRIARNVGRQDYLLNSFVGREDRIAAFTHDRGDGHVIFLRTFGDMVLFHPADLEPILPEGAAPSEFTTLADLLTSLEIDATAPA